MSEPEWTQKELLRIGGFLLTASVIMYAIVVVEVPQSFTEEGNDGLILRFFKTIIGNPRNLAGYNMMLVLATLIIVGGIMGYYGFRTIKRALSMRGKQK